VGSGGVQIEVVVRKVIPVVVVAIVAGCGGSSPISASERDQYNEGVTEINAAWEKFRVAGNACTGADAAACLEGALESSGLPEAVGSLRSMVVKLEANVESGDCQSALDFLEASLHDLNISIDILKYGDIDPNAVEQTADNFRTAWEAAIERSGRAGDACF
jgi:hypothetical protein